MYRGRDVVRVIVRCLVALAVLGIAPCDQSLAASLEETFRQAQEAFKAGNHASAGRLFEQAGNQMHAQGDSARAALLWGNAAVAMLKAEDYAAAAEIYERILGTGKALAPDVALRAYKNLALCRGHLGQRALQVAVIERMLKALPKLPPEEAADAWARLGDAYRALELYTPAAASYAKAARLLPAKAAPDTRAKILTALGLCQGNLGDFDSAAKSLAQARTLAEKANSPLTLAEAGSNLGILLWEKGEYPEARAHIQEALNLEKQAGLRRSEGIDSNNMGLVLKSVGKHKEAMRLVEDALVIAREVGNARDEGIARVNRALINRIAGQVKEARADYREAVKLFEQSGFQEGMAGALLGMGKMAELEDKNYTQALENYEKALAVYERLHLARGHAETLLQIAGLYKRMVAPSRASRDLVFDDTPVVPDITPDEALKKSRAYYTQALKEAEKLRSREMIWSALQGLGYADLREGRLESALDRYDKAIGMVSAMYAALDSVEMLGEYMAGKEDLYGEAQEVCAALYRKTGNAQYLDRQLRLAETLRNEVQKAGSALVRLNFADGQKQSLYDRLNQLGREQAKAVKSLPVVRPLPANADKEQKAAHELEQTAARELQARVQKLDAEYAKLLAEWKEQYPSDSVIFDSSARVDVPMIQKNIGPDHIVLQYITLPDRLLVMAITQNKVTCVTVDVSRKTIEQSVRDDFLLGYIENGYGRKQSFKPGEEEEDLRQVCNTLHTLYGWLIRPVEEELAGKKRIYVVSDGFLAQTPFAALVRDVADGKPRFLVEEYDIAYLRPSFVNVISRPVRQGSVKKMLAVGNPGNSNFRMPKLPGTITEIRQANNAVKVRQVEKTIAFEPIKDNVEALRKDFPDLSLPTPRPTEHWLRGQLRDNRFEIVYFATHGMPYSDTYTALRAFEKDLSQGKSLSPVKQKIKRLSESNLPSLSPLNGFLYLSSEEGDDILVNDIPPHRDGLLTMKEVLELPDASFAHTRYLILSACNTGVTMAPKALRDESTAAVFSAKEVEQGIAEAGWVPGVDQVSFVETFMRKGISNIYGTLWFADDTISAKLMSDFVDNLVSQGDNPDAVAAFNAAQRTLVSDGKAGRPVAQGYDFPHHPFLWAVGAVFGK